MAKGEGCRDSVVPNGHVPKVAGGRVTRRSSAMQCDTPTVAIQPPVQNKNSIAGKRVTLHDENAPMPIPNSTENLAENEVPNPPEKRANTRNEFTSYQAIKQEVVSPEPGSTLSLNMTEIAQVCNKNIRDDEAASSRALPVYRRYTVDPEVAPVLRQIIDKYGDIAKDSNLHDPKFLSFFLEELCRTVERLKSTEFRDLDSDLVEQMCGNIEAMEKMNINVIWLKKKLADIKEVRDMVKIYPAWKEAKNKIENKRAELAVKQREVLVLEEEVKSMEDRYKEIAMRFEKEKERIKATYSSNLADGLL